MPYRVRSMNTPARMRTPVDRERLKKKVAMLNCGLSMDGIVQFREVEEHTMLHDMLACCTCNGAENAANCLAGYITKLLVITGNDNVGPQHSFQRSASIDLLSNFPIAISVSSSDLYVGPHRFLHICARFPTIIYSKSTRRPQQVHMA
jgi:hypothetical protein